MQSAQPELAGHARSDQKTTPLLTHARDPPLTCRSACPSGPSATHSSQCVLQYSANTCATSPAAAAASGMAPPAAAAAACSAATR